MDTHFNTYQAFLEAPERKQYRLWAVTYQTGPDTVECRIFWYEVANAKWYKPEAYEGREEAGCYFDIWSKDPTKNFRVLSVRAVGV